MVGIYSGRLMRNSIHRNTKISIHSCCTYFRRFYVISLTLIVYYRKRFKKNKTRLETAAADVRNRYVYR